MEIKVKVAHISPSMEALREMGTQRISMSLALQMSKMVRVLEDAMIDVGEKQSAILREYGALEDNQGFIPRKDAQNQEIPHTFIIDDPVKLRMAGMRLRELDEATVTVMTVPLSARRLEAEGIRIAGNQAYALDQLLEDDLEVPSGPMIPTPAEVPDGE
jgi:hypothetical protein